MVAEPAVALALPCAAEVVLPYAAVAALLAEAAVEAQRPHAAAERPRAAAGLPHAGAELPHAAALLHAAGLPHAAAGAEPHAPVEAA